MSRYLERTPFLDADLTGPFSSSIFIHPGHRQSSPLPEWTLVWLSSSRHPHIPGNEELATLASGEVEIGQPGSMPSEQSTTGGRQTLPAGLWNSITSVGCNNECAVSHGNSSTVRTGN